MKEGKELYKPADLPAGTHVEPCPVCGAEPQLWQHSTDFKSGPIEKVLMCSNGEKFGPQDGLTNEGCLLYMPPQDFYRGRIVEAVKYWNEYAKALNAQRRQRNWQRAQVLREAPSMDNFQFDMTSQGAETLKKALCLFNPPGRKVSGYSTDGKKLVLYWSESPKATKLPFPMTLEQAADFAAGWLAHANYGNEPDHDGDNGKGWRLYCEGWGYVDGDHYAFAAVQPVWAMYGK